MRINHDTKGVSLAMTIGLLFLLVTMTATINELVIRALRSAHQIEASDKAYFSAEAGVEDALYELSQHTAGYETPDLDSGNARGDDFSNGVSWTNTWEIKNKELNPCITNDWDSFNPRYCGRIYTGEKLVVNMFSEYYDPLPVTLTNAINDDGESDITINKLLVSSFRFRLRLPKTVVSDNPDAFSGTQIVYFDNDRDFDGNWLLTVNEDPSADFGGVVAHNCPGIGAVGVADDDCDGREDEDSPEDPVILWKLVDDAGNSFQPLRGCIGDPRHSSHDAFSTPPGYDNSILCEKNFSKSNDEVFIEFDQGFYGVSMIGSTEDILTLSDFITSIGNNRLQMEILVVTPSQVIDTNNASKVPIPYFEYGIEYDAGPGVELPSTYFSIRSDGYYRDFKQSITTNVTPRATSRLLDLTIIQQ